ncbi:MAG: type II secretion system F family protein [Vampirovibrio sp.]|nr:type II secretion system F family protein [Vampirovibrio sp.]
MIFGLGLDSIILIIVIGVLTFFAMFILSAGVISAVSYKENPVRDRLLALKGMDANELRSDDLSYKMIELQEKLIEKLEPLSRKFYGKDAGNLAQIKNQLTEAGLPDSDDALWRFMAGRIALGFALGGIGFSAALLTGQLIAFVLGGGILGFIIGSMFPQIRLRLLAVKRKDEIRYKLPDTLDLMIVCMEAGLGLDTTIQRVADETEQMAPEISYELKRANHELNAGISRTEVFQNLGTRAGVQELKTLCSMIIQSDKLGTSIGQTLRVYAEDSRVRRKQKAEQIAAKASIKMIFPLVLFIFPPMGIVLIGPVVIEAMGTFF